MGRKRRLARSPGGSGLASSLTSNEAWTHGAASWQVAWTAVWKRCDAEEALKGVPSHLMSIVPYGRPACTQSASFTPKVPYFLCSWCANLFAVSKSGASIHLVFLVGLLLRNR